MKQISTLVAQPTGNKLGHYAIHTTRLANALSTLNHRVVVLTDRLDANPFGGWQPNVTVEEMMGGKLAFVEPAGNGVSHRLHYWFQYFRNSLICASRAVAYARAAKVQNLYITDAEFLMLALALFFAPNAGAGVIIQVNAANFDFSKYNGGLAKKLYKVVQKSVFKLLLRSKPAITLSVLSNWHLKELSAQLDLHHSRFVVVPAGSEATDSPINKAIARRALRLDSSHKIFLIFGNLRTDKDYETALKALSKTAEKNVRYLFCGAPTGVDPAWIESLIDDLKLGDRVYPRMLRYLTPEEVRAAFSASDFLLLPYKKVYRDGAGPLQKEAAMYQLPAIVSDVAGMSDVVEEFDLGLSFHAEDADSLAETLNDAVALADERIVKFKDNLRVLGEKNSFLAQASTYARVWNHKS